MGNITRRAFMVVAGSAALGLVGCGGSGASEGGSAPKPKKVELAKEPSKDDIVFTMEPVINWGTPYFGDPMAVYITKIKNNSDQVAASILVDGISKKADGTLDGAVEQREYRCLNPGEEAWFASCITGCDERPASLELSVRAEFEKPSEKASYQFEVLNTAFDEEMMKFQLEIVNDSEFDYTYWTTVFLVLKDADGNVVNGGYGTCDEIDAGDHLVIGDLNMWGFDETGSPYASYEYSISKGI